MSKENDNFITAKRAIFRRIKKMFKLRGETKKCAEELKNKLL
jgi:hypothetical protein